MSEENPNIYLLKPRILLFVEREREREVLTSRKMGWDRLKKNRGNNVKSRGKVAPSPCSRELP